MQQPGEESNSENVHAESFDWSSSANTSEETKAYIGKIMDRGLESFDWSSGANIPEETKEYIWKIMDDV